MIEIRIIIVKKYRIFNILFRFLQDAQYKAEYHAEHPTIKFFWEVFHELSDEDKKNFLSKSDPCFLLVLCKLKQSKVGYLFTRVIVNTFKKITLIIFKKKIQLFTFLYRY